MVLAQGRFWRAEIRKGSQAVTLAILKESLPAELEELKDLRMEIPFAEWYRVVKHVRADRKLLGGILLSFAKNEDHLSAAIGSDRLLSALRVVVGDATTCLVEEGVLTLVPVPSET